MHGRPFVRARSLVALIATAASLVTLPSPSIAATCQAWSGQPPAIGNEWSGLNDVAVISPCKAFAVGTYRHDGAERALIGRWNGTKWSIVDLPDFGATHEGLQGVAAASANDVWAVGNVITETFKDRPLILRWQGRKWNQIPTPATGESKLYAVDVVAPDDIWVVGQRRVDGTDQPLIERWNGVKWKVIPTPEFASGGELYAVDASGPNSAWAVGGREVGGQTVPLTMRWNGTRWSVRSAPTIDDEDFHLLHGVVTISRSKAWAVGNACDLSDRCDSRVLHFDGSGWRVQPSATFGDGSQFDGIGASSPTNVWAVGSTFAPSTFTPFAVHCC